MKKMSTIQKIGLIVACAIIVLLIIYGMSVITKSRISGKTSTQNELAVKDLLGVNDYEKLNISKISEGYEEIEEVYTSKNASGENAGYVVFTSVNGYGGPIKVQTAVDPKGEKIIQLRIGENNETEGLGALIKDEKFYSQFEGKTSPIELHKIIATSNNTELKDGQYRAENSDYSNGYKYFVELDIKNGKIANAFWDGISESGESKRELSKNGEYIMTETGPKWHEQAQSMENLLLEIQEPSKIYFDENGKTDAVSSVSISINDFVSLAQKCLNTSKGETDDNSQTNVIQGVTGASISSKAVVMAANKSLDFVSKNLSK